VVCYIPANIQVKHSKIYRAMSDQDGPVVAKLFYKNLFANEIIDADSIAYALDYAVTDLRKGGAPPERWATFIHMGA
jgi:hypothetical protein